jgi:outer membrane protein TolC
MADSLGRERALIVRARALAVLTALALLPGCATVEDARDAQDDSKAIPGERTPGAAEIGLVTSGVVTLDQVVHAALMAHPSVVKAHRSAEAAGARVGEAEGAFWPQASTGTVANFRYETTNAGQAHATAAGHGFQSFGFQVSWLLFDFGRTPALYRQAGKQALAAQKDARSAEVNAAFAARSSFFNLVKQRELLVVARETVGQFETRLEQVRGFVKVGTRVPYDLTKAQVDLGTARLNEIKARDAVRIAAANLANSVGLAEEVDWVPAAGPPLPPFTLTFAEAWDEAKKNQPDLAAAEAREKAASDLVDAQIAALYPSISAVAGYSAGGFNFPLTWNWQLGPSLNWIIFDGFTNLYTIDEAAANLRAARAARTLVEQQVWLDVKTAYISLEDAKERLDLTALTVRQAEENLTLAQGRYEVGKATAVDLTDAQVALAQARADHVQARADHDTAIAALWKTLGMMEWRVP